MISSLEKIFYRRGLAFQWLGVIIGSASFAFRWSSLFFWSGIFMFFLGWMLEIMSHGNVTFWAKVRDYPDLAYDWFKSNDNWVVIDGSPLSDPKETLPKKLWVGPFQLSVPKLQGRIIKIYGKAHSYEQNQAKFLQLVQAIEN